MWKALSGIRKRAFRICISRQWAVGGGQWENERQRIKFRCLYCFYFRVLNDYGINVLPTAHCPLPTAHCLLIDPARSRLRQSLRPWS
jgi:hypothetical protein